MRLVKAQLFRKVLFERAIFICPSLRFDWGTFFIVHIFIDWEEVWCARYLWEASLGGCTANRSTRIRVQVAMATLRHVEE